jgi:prephenate dehydrogenase
VASAPRASWSLLFIDRCVAQESRQSNMSVHSAQRNEVRICVFVSSPMMQLVAVLEEVKSPTQRVTVVGDTLSAARDIVTATRMMCIVTPRARDRRIVSW